MKRTNRNKKLRRGGSWERGRDRGWEPAAEKYSRFLQPPLPVSAGHDCYGKPETKPEKEKHFSGRTALSLAQKAPLH